MPTEFDFDVLRITGDEHYGSYEVTTAMKQSGWVGGQWIRFNSLRSVLKANSIIWSRLVEPYNDQDPMMFILRASYEGTDHYTARYPGKTGEVTCCNYGQHLFKYFERNDLAERTNPGTGAPLVYNLNINLYVSNRGLLTSERESGWDSRGVGLCMGLPADNNNYLGCEVLIGPS